MNEYKRRYMQSVKDLRAHKRTCRDCKFAGTDACRMYDELERIKAARELDWQDHGYFDKAAP